MTDLRERRAPRSVPVPTGGAAALLFAAAVVVAVARLDDWRVVVVLIALIVTTIGIDAVLAPAPGTVEVERSLPTGLTVGDRAAISWVIRNRGDRRVRTIVADSLWPSLGASRRQTSATIDPGRQHRFSATFQPSRRGRFPFGAVTIRTAGPMRLASRQQTRDVPGTVAVLPAHPSRDDVAARLRTPTETGLRSVRSKGTGTDFDQLREYRPGDDLRRLDWAATARTARPIVREYRADRHQQVVILLDNGRVMAGSTAGVPRVEHAMDAALGLATAARRFGDNVGLVTFDQQVRAIVPPGHGPSQFTRLAEAMYLLDPSYDESAYRAAVTLAASRFRRRSLVVVFTDLVEGLVADTVLPALRTLTTRHLVVVAAVRDPAVATWSELGGHAPAHEPLDATASYRAAAAVTALGARDRAAAVLGAAGIVVVDAEPGSLAVDVVDRYLEFKASGRL